MSRTASGFTLIELMIVVAIIAILAAIALPAYNLYRIKAAEAACEMEMKNYANFALVALHVGGTPGGPPQRACLTTTTATALTVPIIGTPQTPGSKQTTCDMNTATCTIAT